MVARKRKTDRQLIEEAVRWLDRLDAGAASQADFEAWRAADPRHAVIFLETAATWRSVGRLGQSDGDDPDSTKT